MMENQPLYAAEGLECTYRITRRTWLRNVSETITLLSGVSLAVQPGESVAVVGAPGSGKTVLAETLALMRQPKAGQVWFAGQQLAGQPERKLRSVRPKLQFVFGDPRRALSPKTGVRQILQDAQSLFQGKPEDIGSILTEVGLNHFLAERPLSTLSVVQRQRVALARALVLQPKVLIWDDPVALFNLAGARAILETLTTVLNQRGLAIIWTTTQPQLAAQFAQRSYTLQHGRLAL